MHNLSFALDYSEDWVIFVLPRNVSVLRTFNTLESIFLFSCLSSFDSFESFERSTPLSPMNSLPLGKKQRPALHLDVNSQHAYGSPLSRLTAAARGSVVDLGTTLVNERSRASTPTPSPRAIERPVMGGSLHLSTDPEASNEPKKIFVVKVCHTSLENSHLLSNANRTPISSFPASNVNPIP